ALRDGWGSGLRSLRQGPGFSSPSRSGPAGRQFFLLPGDLLVSPFPPRLCQRGIPEHLCITAPCGQSAAVLVEAADSAVVMEPGELGAVTTDRPQLPGHHGCNVRYLIVFGQRGPDFVGQ